MSGWHLADGGRIVSACIVARFARVRIVSLLLVVRGQCLQCLREPADSFRSCWWCADSVCSVCESLSIRFASIGGVRTVSADRFALVRGARTVSVGGGARYRRCTSMIGENKKKLQ